MLTIPQFLCLFWVLGLVSSNNCLQADQYECQSSLCPQFYFSTNVCLLNTSSTCTSVGYVWHNGLCTGCSTLSQNNCSTICPDHVWNSLSSGPSGCVPCWTLFSQQCIQCSSSGCFGCSKSSSLVPSLDNKNCVNKNCQNLSFCLQCSADGLTCLRCVQGYSLSGSKCSVAFCSIPNCKTCMGTLCLFCQLGYRVSSNHMICQPECPDVYCNECSHPFYCRTCTFPYYPNNRGGCKINCSEINVTNCVSCSGVASCYECSSGYVVVPGGNYCQRACTVANCELCPTSPWVCFACKTGYILSNGSSGGNLCSYSISCNLPNCEACSSLTTCSKCIPGFSLSLDNTTCTSACPSQGRPNCLLCNSSACILCQSNYVLSGVACVLPWSTISNCIAYISSNLCGSCLQGYRLSADYRKCETICLDEGCLSCSNDTAPYCYICKANYLIYTDPLTNTIRCSLLCGKGWVAVSQSTPACVDCSYLITGGACADCEVSALTGQAYCLSCWYGFYLSDNSQCISCRGQIPNCMSCSAATVCEPFSLMQIIQDLCSNGTCSRQASLSYSCTTKVACTLCDRYYYVVKGSCQPETAYEASGCLVRNSSANNTCIFCKPDYKLLSNGSCAFIACPDGYVTEINTKSCVCPLGTYPAAKQLNLGHPVCLACSHRCTNCSISICFACAQGFYPQRASCFSCLPNCQLCFSSQKCHACSFGYSLISGDCLPLGSYGTKSLDGLFYRCEPGCSTCSFNITNNRTYCAKAQKGYSVDYYYRGLSVVSCSKGNYQAIACQRDMKPTCVPGKLFMRYLSNQQCYPCGGYSYTLECSQIDVNFNLACINATIGHRSSFPQHYSRSCTSCSSNCIICTVNGPGSCDFDGCRSGTVQLVGTSNCTYCFRGCSVCDHNNPGVCLSCGVKAYKDSNNNCVSCLPDCLTCRDALSCDSCSPSSQLINSRCYTLVPYCARRSVAVTCEECFQGYILDGGKQNCLPNLSCSTQRNCIACPSGYQLYSGSCHPCPYGCQQCNIYGCWKCISGYFISGYLSSGNCSLCPPQCQECADYLFCNKPADGYYLLTLSDNSNSGRALPCFWTCATCIDHQKHCLTCIPGYTLQGTQCRQNLYLSLSFIIFPSLTNSIFSPNSSTNDQIALATRSINRIGASIDAITPASFKDGREWRDRLTFTDIGYNPTTHIYFTLDAGNNNDINAMKAQMELAVSSATFDGFTVALVQNSALVRSPRGSSQQQRVTLGSRNLLFILVLAIPLCLLSLLLLIILIKRCRPEEKVLQLRVDEGESEHDDKMRPRDIVDSSSSVVL